MGKPAISEDPFYIGKMSVTCPLVIFSSSDNVEVFGYFSKEGSFSLPVPKAQCNYGKGPSFLPNNYHSVAVDRKIYDNNQEFFDRHTAYAIPHMVKWNEKMGKFYNLPFATRAVQCLYKLAGEYGKVKRYGTRFIHTAEDKVYNFNETIDTLDITSNFSLEPYSSTTTLLSYRWKTYRIVEEWNKPFALAMYLHHNRFPIDSDLKKQVEEAETFNRESRIDIKDYLLKNM